MKIMDVVVQIMNIMPQGVGIDMIKLFIRIELLIEVATQDLHTYHITSTPTHVSYRSSCCASLSCNHI